MHACLPYIWKFAAQGFNDLILMSCTHAAYTSLLADATKLVLSTECFSSDDHAIMLLKDVRNTIVIIVGTTNY